MLHAGRVRWESRTVGERRSSLWFGTLMRLVAGGGMILVFRARNNQRRFLLHVLALQFLRVRYFGFLAARCRCERLPLKAPRRLRGRTCCCRGGLP